MSFKWIINSKLINFEPIFTEEGLCFTFNGINSVEIYSSVIAPKLMTVVKNLNAKHWNKEDGYQSNVNESEIYPYRISRDGFRHSMQFDLSTYLLDDSYEICKSALGRGFTILLHAPDELPKFFDNCVYTPAGQILHISVKPKMITTSSGLRIYTPVQRGCYFKSERQLRFYNSYSENKCELECLANFTRNRCGCVRYWMPRAASTSVCSIVDMKCYKKAESEFTNELIVENCDCLPDCTLIEYDFEVLQPGPNMKTYKPNFMKDSTDVVFANNQIFISFKKHNFIALNRSETSTLPDFISSCGGLLGLFMGISVLSLIEFIYFSCQQLYVKMKRQKKVGA